MAFGIDFGTTNSAIVYDRSHLLGIQAGQPFPSIVAINRNTGQILCGPAAREQQQALQASNYEVIRSVKRYFDSPGQRWSVAGKQWSPQDVACELFKALRKHANDHTLSQGQQLTSAVVAIPVNFSARSRRLLRDAAQAAGITITTFVSEPTAAYFQQRQGLPECRRVAVFDWGGGTLDVSVLGIDGHQVDELATRGWSQAGDAVDETIARWVHEQITGQDGRTFDHVPAVDKDNLLLRCELAKRQLSEHQTTPIQLLRYMDHSHVRVELDRAQLRTLTHELVQHALSLLDTALREAGVSDDQLDCVLPVGGSSNLVAVQEALEERFEARLARPDRNPAWVVAQGASALTSRSGRYRPMQRLCLVLADEQETALDLIQPEDAFDGKARQHHLGIVEDTKVAQLVFAESVSWKDRTKSAVAWPRIGFMTVPVQGFYRERVSLTTALTKDLTFEAAAQGDGMNEDDRARWTYEKVRFSYELP